MSILFICILIIFIIFLLQILIFLNIMFWISFYVYSVLTSVKKKKSIDKIRTNSQYLHSETRCWAIPKMTWDERVGHLSDTKKVEDEKHFLLNSEACTQIRYHFQNICHTTNLTNLLTQQKYGDLRKLPLML